MCVVGHSCSCVWVKAHTLHCTVVVSDTTVNHLFANLKVNRQLNNVMCVIWSKHRKMEPAAQTGRITFSDKTVAVALGSIKTTHKTTQHQFPKSSRLGFLVFEQDTQTQTKTHTQTHKHTQQHTLHCPVVVQSWPHPSPLDHNNSTVFCDLY